MEVESLLRSMPLEQLDEAWARRLRAEQADRRAQWMAAADAMRDQPGESRARAQAVYWALRQDLDAADADSAARIRIVLLSGVPRDLAFETLARRAVDRGEGDLALMGRVAIAQCASQRGDHDAAERDLLDVLRVTRGRGDWLEHKTLGGLSLAFLSKGQELEGLVFAHHAVATLEPDADPWTQLAAHQRLCQSLWAVGDHEGLAIALERFEQVLGDARTPWSQPARRYVHQVRAELALDAGRLTIARGELAKVCAARASGHAAPVPTNWSTRLEARILRALGQPRSALKLLSRGSGELGFRAGLLATACAFDLEEYELAREHGRRVLDVVESGDDPAARHGTGGHVRLAAALGSLFHEHAVDDEIGRRAFDEAARSALTRLVDLRRCRERLPEVVALTRDELEILKGYHHRFVAQHAVFLNRLVPYLETELREGGAAFEDLFHHHDYLLICGWCHRVRERDGEWLPIGHFLPDTSSLRVTHGICPTCRTAVGRDTIGG